MVRKLSRPDGAQLADRRPLLALRDHRHPIGPAEHRLDQLPEVGDGVAMPVERRLGLGLRHDVPELVGPEGDGGPRQGQRIRAVDRRADDAVRSELGDLGPGALVVGEQAAGDALDPHAVHRFELDGRRRDRRRRVRPRAAGPHGRRRRASGRTARSGCPGRSSSGCSRTAAARRRRSGSGSFGRASGVCRLPGPAARDDLREG